MVKMRQCEGNGLGTCTLCNRKGIWNRRWMCFLYKIDGMDGCYCYDCANEILAKINSSDESERVYLNFLSSVEEIEL